VARTAPYRYYGTHKQASVEPLRGTSAYRPLADMLNVGIYVRFVPIADNWKRILEGLLTHQSAHIQASALIPTHPYSHIRHGLY
jgi:hypothetical protein